MTDKPMRPLEMKISLQALEHLGMNLYSTIPAVLAEIVANAWDADASRVSVELGQEISIQDDGVGMTRAQVIERFLIVGFQRRHVMGTETSKGRQPMGRKGIGKLSSFSVATVVTVYTIRDGERTAFRMDAERIRTQIQNDEGVSCRVDEINSWPPELTSGTRITLSNLKHQTTKQTTRGLRQRIARRFSVIGPQNGFTVSVDGEDISPGDRGYDQHVEYVWSYGDQSKTLNRFPNLAENRPPPDRSAERSAACSEISGWIGTVRRSGSLKADDGDNLNRLEPILK